MLAVGNEELTEPLGDKIKCWICGEFHPVKYGDLLLPDGTLESSKMLAFFSCGDKSYLCGIDGKLLRPKGG